MVSALPGAPLADGRADLVYTGKGALIWMPDLAAWARDAARLLRPGGHLFVFEGRHLGEHPDPFWRMAGVTAAAWNGRLPNTFSLRASRS